LKQPKAPKAPKEEVVKKVKPRVSKPAAKAIVKVKTMDDLGAMWVERWIENYVACNSLPPQLISNDFISLSGRFMGALPAMNVIEQIRKQYKAAFFNTDEEDSFQFLLDAVEKDPILKSNPLLNPDE
jgi:hypothetical protein